MKICYKKKRFHNSTLDMIGKANQIITDYIAQGYDLTLRQLYYKLFALDLFPDDRRWRWVTATGKWVRDPNGTKNADPNYKWLGTILNDARLAGLVDWNIIIDRTRNLERVSSWNTPAEYLMPESFHMNMWETQDTYCEVWIEKDALIGVIAGVCNKWDVPYTSCRGYSSQSTSWRAGRRIAQKIHAGKAVTVFHLGDHDPSGIDMTRDNQERLDLFDAMGAKVKRLALNMDQVEQWNPPPSPAKVTDSRCAKYIAKYGNKSWELDALEPREIERLIEKNVKPLIDTKVWKAREAEIQCGCDLLVRVKNRWDEIMEFLNA